MDHRDLIRELRAAKKELEPFTTPPSRFASPNNPYDLRWNSKEYAPYDPADVPFDPYALAWSASLHVIAEFLEAQQGPPTARQKEILRKELFGKDGLIEFTLDQSLGAEGERATKCLRARAERIWEILERLP